MIVLLLGMALWWASHLFPIFAPDRRAGLIARLGEGPYKGVFAGVSILAVVLMVLGYGASAGGALWVPPGWLIHLNNLLMVLAIALVTARGVQSAVVGWVRHPMLTGVKVWAVAHLLVNPTPEDIVLFGGLLGWAVVAMIGSNKRDGKGPKPAGRGMTANLAHVAIVAVVFLGVTFAHNWIGVWPFPGAS